MKKNVLSKLGLLALCFGLVAGVSACGEKTEEPASDANVEAPADGEDATEPSDDATTPDDAADTTAPVDGEDAAE